MKGPSVWFLCLRYLFEPGPGRSLSFRRIRGGILGLALSLVPLVVVYEVADGMIRGITERYIEAGSHHLQLTLTGPDGSDTVPDSAVDQIRQQPGVRWAGVERNGFALVSSRYDSLGVNVRALSADIASEPGFTRCLQVREGSFDLDDPAGMVLGEEAARVLRVKVGDEVRLVTGSLANASGLPPRVSRFTVKGVASVGYQELDRLWVFINLERGRRVLPPGSASEFMAVKLLDPYSLPNPLFAPLMGIDQSGDSADPVLAMAKSLGRSWYGYGWFELNRSKFLSFLTTRNLLIVIMVLIVLVASVNVSSAMIMLVLEKQAEIAILKSLGARPGGIALVFILAGGITGFLGSLLGLAAGSAAALGINEIIGGIEWLVNAFAWLGWQLSGQAGLGAFEELKILNPSLYLTHIPVSIRLPELAVIGLLSVALSMAASWFPARRAGRLRPLTVLRKA